MKKLLLILTVMVGFSLQSCGVEAATKQDSSDKVLAHKQEQIMQEANASIGMPAIKNFQERKIAKKIFEMRDDAKLVCYAYLVNKNTGKPVFLGKCIGFGLPYSVQYTNPIKTVDKHRSRYQDGSGITTEQLPQADPNGLFMPTGLSATWLLLINPITQEPTPVYVEPEIIVSPFPLL